MVYAEVQESHSDHCRGDKQGSYTIESATIPACSSTFELENNGHVSERATQATLMMLMTHTRAVVLMSLEGVFSVEGHPTSGTYPLCCRAHHCDRRFEKKY